MYVHIYMPLIMLSNWKW